MISTISELIDLNKEKGKHFFDSDTTRFFQSHIPDDLIVHEGKAYFLTSEQFVEANGTKHDRRYSVRAMDLDTGAVDTIGEFQQFATAREARRDLHKWRGY